MNGVPILSVMTWAPFVAALIVMFFARTRPLLGPNVRRLRLRLSSERGGLELIWLAP